jgi:hypothetical protein
MARVTPAAVVWTMLAGLAVAAAFGGGPSAPEQTSSAMMLGPVDQKVGAYLYPAPTGWTAQQPKDSNLAMMYRSPDKAGVILVQIKLKGGVGAKEMKPRYTQEVIQMLRQGFAKNKTEVIDPPAVVKDPRFYLKVQEKFKTKGDKAGSSPPKTAIQTHIYRVEGADMIELTAISTSEKLEDAAVVQKLAEEMTLAFKPQKQ